MSENDEIILHLAGGLPSPVQDLHLHLEGFVDGNFSDFLSFALVLIFEYEILQAFDFDFVVHWRYYLAL